MDRSQIKKLIELANNNPNSNEANAAARKVCELLEEYSFPEEDKQMDMAKWCLRHHAPKSQCKCG